MIAFCCKDKPAGNHLKTTMTVLKTRNDLTNYALVRRTQDGYLTLDLQYGMCQRADAFQRVLPHHES